MLTQSQVEQAMSLFPKELVKVSFQTRTNEHGSTTYAVISLRVANSFSPSEHGYHWKDIYFADLSSIWDFKPEAFTKQINLILCDRLASAYQDLQGDTIVP